MVYDANPISKEQLEIAVNDQLESAGLPTDGDALIEMIEEHGGSNDSFQIWIGSYDPTDKITPILPMDCEIDFGNENNADLVAALRTCTFHPDGNGEYRISQFMYTIDGSNDIQIVYGTSSRTYSNIDDLIDVLVAHGPYHFEWAFESGTAIGWGMAIKGDIGGAVSLTIPWQHRVYYNRRN